MQHPVADPVGIIGLGHVGLPTALGLAECGWTVIGTDDDQQKIAQLSRGQAPFHEPGIEEALQRHLSSGRFQVCDDFSTTVQKTTIHFVCVGTPQLKDGSADLSQIETVAKAIARSLNGYKLVVEKSTTPVHTAEHIKRTIQKHLTSAHDFDVAVNPEFLREGSALDDFMHPDRIVIGVDSDRARDLLTMLYEPLLNRLPTSAIGSQRDSSERLLVTDLNTAEIVKHASNAFLATKVSFINMVSDICSATGADINEVALGLQTDHRIGRHFLQAGIGYGGYCLPKDLRAFAKIAEDNNVDASLLKAVESINNSRIGNLLKILEQALGDLTGRTLGVWGLAFKPGTDDIREAPSLKIIPTLQEKGAILRLHDPQAISAFQSHWGNQQQVIYCDSPKCAANNADAVVLLTDWPEYTALNLSEIKKVMASPTIVDGRNSLDGPMARQLGFHYYGMGR